MNPGRLELSDLGDLVLEERTRRRMSLREAARTIGIPFNTLARVEKGHVPDLPKFKRLVEWCGADIKQFFEIQERATATTDVIAAHLRADRNLPPDGRGTDRWHRRRPIPGPGASPGNRGSAFASGQDVPPRRGPLPRRVA